MLKLKVPISGKEQRSFSLVGCYSSSFGILAILALLMAIASADNDLAKFLGRPSSCGCCLQRQRYLSFLFSFGCIGQVVPGQLKH